MIKDLSLIIDNKLDNNLIIRFSKMIDKLNIKIADKISDQINYKIADKISVKPKQDNNY